MSNGDATLLRIAAEELAGRGGPRPASDGTGGPGGEDAGSGARKRMFMAGRLGPDASRVHFGESARAPVEGPWELALVVRRR